MSSLSTPAIVLRRIEYGDFDLILSFLTWEKGKLCAIAKSARKSTRRFGGILELFAALDILCSSGRRGGLPVLQEASLKQPFAAIRASIVHTAYASYWAELIDGWSEEGERQPDLYTLLLHVLTELSRGRTPADVLSIFFQIRFLVLSGHGPNLRSCSRCQRAADRIGGADLTFEPARGGIVCADCRAAGPGRLTLSRGTLKQLQGLETMDLSKAGRLRFSPAAIAESLAAMEAFVPYQMGREPRSLTFLRQIRKPATNH
ncbi:MAG: DNA repair protein RecO [Desulfobacterales bacterium]